MASGCKEGIEVGKGLIRLFKPRKLLLVFLFPFTPKPLQWLSATGTKASLASVLLEILSVHLPVGNTCPNIGGETFPGGSLPGDPGC